MNYIQLKDIHVDGNRIEYIYDFDEETKQYFFEEPFYIEYQINGTDIDMNSISKSSLAIPFVCNLIAFVWLKDIKLVVPELDADFYNSIHQFEKGYIEMYPDAQFKGEIAAEKLVKSNVSEKARKGLFFSAGLDAFCSLVQHLNENPVLVAIWGADVSADNLEGWKNLYGKLKIISAEYGLDLVTIHSSFRKVLNTGKLSKKFDSWIHDEWWHAVQHGPAIIAHAAPLVHIFGIDIQYIASSFCPQDGKVTCCSYPTIDNYIKMSGCSVVHDGFELSRIDKVKVVSKYKNEYNKKVSLHVCWKREDGHNCCECEKCLRTMAEFWVIGEDPRDYGFRYDKKTFLHMKYFLMLKCQYNKWLSDYWMQIQNEMKDNHDLLINKDYYHSVNWIETFDFRNPENNIVRKLYILGARLKRSIGFKL